MSGEKRLRDVFKFSKPKNPGFGISADYYLSVLSTVARLPVLAEVLNPKGENGAVIGFAAPLAAGATKDDLTRPMERGVYAFSSRDRKTVLKARVIPRDEVQFDPEPYLRLEVGVAKGPDFAARMRSTWSIIQLTFESHDPMVYPALDFLLDVTKRLGDLTQGIIADPLSQAYRLPEELRAPDPPDAPVDVRNFVQILTRGSSTYTMGLIKFAQPELEITGLDQSLLPDAHSFLLGLSHSILLGKVLTLGAKVGSARAPFQVCEGGLDKRYWDGIDAYELIPAGNNSVAQCFEAWRTGA